MLDANQIADKLKSQNVNFHGEIIKDIFEFNKFYIFIKTSIESTINKNYSEENINSIKEYFSSQNVNIEIILINSINEDIESGYRASMLISFHDFIENSFLTIKNNLAIAWISPKVQLTEEKFSQIESKTRSFLSNFNIQLSHIEYTSISNLPGKLACLSVLRILAPIDLEALTKALRNRKFNVPSETWTARMMDSLRKSGLVMRRKSGQYIVTASGLKSLGTLKSGKSPDITRMLALARQGE